MNTSGDALESGGGTSRRSAVALDAHERRTERFPVRLLGSAGLEMRARQRGPREYGRMNPRRVQRIQSRSSVSA